MADRREKIAKQLVDVRQRLALLTAEKASLEREDRDLEVARCEHVWKDTGWESHHNGDWEAEWTCQDCKHKVYADPGVGT